MTNGSFGTLFTLGVGIGIGYFLGADRWRDKYDRLTKAFKVYADISETLIEVYKKQLDKFAKEKKGTC